MPDEGRRRRWLVRGAAAALVLAALVAWGRVFFFDAPPPDDADLLPPPVAEVRPGENAWEDLDSLGSALPGTRRDDPRRLVNPHIALPSTPHEWSGTELEARVHEQLSAIEDQLARLDSAFARPRWVIHTDLPRPGRNRTHHAETIRDIISWLRLRHGVAMLEGRRNDALADVLRWLELGARIQSAERATILDSLTGIGVEPSGTLALLATIERFSFDDSELTSIGTRLATLPDPIAAYERTLRWEYARWRERISRRESTWFFKPNRSLRYIGHAYRIAIARSRSPAAEGQDTDSSAVFELRELLAGNSAYLANEMLPPRLDPSRRAVAKSIFLCDALVTIIALERFRLREGALPPTLDALVPDLLAAVPTDPFVGGPIRYDPVRGILWSPGQDGIDGGGSFAPDARITLDEPTVRIPRR